MATLIGVSHSYMKISVHLLRSPLLASGVQKYFSLFIRSIHRNNFSLPQYCHGEEKYYFSSHVRINQKKRKTFCCYNCLDLNHAQSFLPVFVNCFPQSLEQEKCLEKVRNSQPSASNLHNLTSTQFSCSQELGKQVNK